MSALTIMLRAIHEGEFDAADYDDATVQLAIKRGLVDPLYVGKTTSLSLTETGRYEAGLIECSCGKCGDCQRADPRCP